MMLCTAASSLSCDRRDHVVSHHGNGELRSHGKSAFNVNRRGRQEGILELGDPEISFQNVHLHQALLRAFLHLGIRSAKWKYQFLCNSSVVRNTEYVQIQQQHVKGGEIPMLMELQAQI